MGYKVSPSLYLCLHQLTNDYSAVDLATYVSYAKVSEEWEVIPSTSLACPVTIVPFHSQVVDEDLWVSVSFDRVRAIMPVPSSSHHLQSGIEPEDSILDDPDPQDTEHEFVLQLSNSSPLLTDFFAKIMMYYCGQNVYYTTLNLDRLQTSHLHLHLQSEHQDDPVLRRFLEWLWNEASSAFHEVGEGLSSV
jgi:hypothetical protein